MSRPSPLDARDGLQRVGLRANSASTAKRAKLAFAAAEDARRRGDVREHARLVARWRELTKGVPCAG